MNSPDDYSFESDSNTFKDKLNTFEINIDPVAVFLKIAEQNSWDEHDIGVLTSLSPDQYYKIFKTHRGQDLSRMISGVLQFDRIVNASPQMREITKRVKEALTRIGNESEINARRVRKYGIKVNEEAGNPAIPVPAEPGEV